MSHAMIVDLLTFVCISNIISCHIIILDLYHFRGRLADMNERMSRLERKVDYLEARVGQQTGQQQEDEQQE